MTARFAWYDLMTLDAAAAQTFYGAAIGWTTEKWTAADYTMWKAPSGPVGGLMILPDDARAMGAPPHWMGYVSVDSAAETTALVQSLGGRVYVPPTALPDGAQFAVVADPQGASFGLHQAAPGAPAMPDKERGPGEFSWCELMTSDPTAAMAFYATVLGWTPSGSMDMGPEMGTYEMFTTKGGERSIGGMMKLPPGMPVASWLHYVNVAHAGATVEKVKAGGGTVLYGPADVPGGKVASFMDPQGAAFAVFASE